jgi:peptide/nickel transport system permease protein
MDNFLLRNVYDALKHLTSRKITLVPFIFLLGMVFLAYFGPWIAPYSATEVLYGPDGELLRAAPPSLSHPLGTTGQGYDVLSRVIIGARPTLITGLVGGSMVMGIGLTIGVTAGYVGGVVDEILMRVTDMAYSVPLIPFAIVMLAFFGFGFYASIFVIGLLLWRAYARVLRSQVLQIKQREYIESARALGASDTRIVVKHILPNIASMAFLFFALGMGYAIIVQAGLAFIGVTNPFVPSWGVMIRNAYNSGYYATRPLWALTPGLLISLTVLSAFLLGREYESETSDEVLAS